MINPVKQSDDTCSVLPITLDMTRVSIMLIGGDTLLPRLRALDQRGGGRIRIFAADPSPALIEAADARLVARWPNANDFDAFAPFGPTILFIADLPAAEATNLRTMAHARGALVHVHDDVLRCDFHMPAILRHGALQVAVSTAGAAPGLARMLRDHIARFIGAEWAGRTEELAVARRTWKAMKLNLAHQFEAFVAEKGWFARR